MVIISTRAVEVSIQAVSPESIFGGAGVAAAGAAAAGAAAGGAAGAACPTTTGAPEVCAWTGVAAVKIRKAAAQAMTIRASHVVTLCIVAVLIRMLGITVRRCRFRP